MKDQQTIEQVIADYMEPRLTPSKIQKEYEEKFYIRGFKVSVMFETFLPMYVYDFSYEQLATYLKPHLGAFAGYLNTIDVDFHEGFVPYEDLFTFSYCFERVM